MLNLNFSWLSDSTYQEWLKEGILNTILLSVECIFFSLVIGVVGVWLQGLRWKWVHQLLQGYIQIFRNTPPLVQLFFLFFVLAAVLPKVYDPTTGGERPILSSFGSAIIALSLFAGAFNIEIFRSGIEAVPKTMVEASESLGFSRSQCFLLVIMPLAFRICLPALNNNLVNLVKTTTLASAIATPELLYYAGQIYADNFATLEVMLFIWLVYIILVGILIGIMNWIELKLRIPGYGN
ncbi:MAG: amino acid ABC transporter permease [Nostocaceae cyanobacterium]|nr:amino acid ABC transporter permease [Nostocaceae cyanobacterium]